MNQKNQELKSNLLADRLEEFFIGLKPYLKWIAAALVVLIAVSIAFGLRQQTAEKLAAESWSDFYFAAGRSDQLDTIYQTYPGTKGALWARQIESDSLMGRALTSVYLDRDLSDELFTQAAKGYQDILKQTSDPLLTSRATLGLAQSLDGQGKSAEALTQYKQLLTIKGIHEGLTEDIQRRVEFIESNEGKTFFTWYKDNRPTAPTPVNLPGNINQLPGMPDLQFTTPAMENTQFEAPKSNASETPAAETTGSMENAAPSNEPSVGSPTEPSSFSLPAEVAEPTSAAPADTPPADTPPAETAPLQTPPPIAAPESGS